MRQKSASPSKLPRFGSEFGFVYPAFYRALSLDTWYWPTAKFLPNSRAAVDLYVTIMLFIEVACCILSALEVISANGLKILIFILLGFRLVDITLVILGQLCKGSYMRREGWASASRTFLLTLVNVVEVFFIYAVFFSMMGREAYSFNDQDLPYHLGFGTWLYFSFVSGLTLGYGDIVPINSCARIVAVSEPFLMVVLLLNMVSFVRGGYSGPTREQPRKSTKG